MSCRALGPQTSYLLAEAGEALELGELRDHRRYGSAGDKLAAKGQGLLPVTIGQQAVVADPWFDANKEERARRLLSPLQGFWESVVDPLTWGSRAQATCCRPFGAGSRGIGCSLLVAAKWI